jgi:riboflavin-specific deaminase-like protein
LARPQITLKLATSLDGKIALKNGMSEWITGSKSREYGRKLRSNHDAILIGSNTAVLDNPQLTTRIEGENDPIRIVFDTNLRISEKSNLVLTAKKVPVWIFHGSDDKTVHPNESLKMAKAIIKFGGSPKITFYENVKHGSWNNAFAEKDFLKWIHSKTKKK